MTGFLFCPPSTNLVRGIGVNWLVVEESGAVEGRDRPADGSFLASSARKLPVPSRPLSFTEQFGVPEPLCQMINPSADERWQTGARGEHNMDDSVLAALFGQDVNERAGAQFCGTGMVRQHRDAEAGKGGGTDRDEIAAAEARYVGDILDRTPGPSSRHVTSPSSPDEPRVGRSSSTSMPLQAMRLASGRRRCAGRRHQLCRPRSSL